MKWHENEDLLIGTAIVVIILSVVFAFLWNGIGKRHTILELVKEGATPVAAACAVKSAPSSIICYEATQ